MDSPLLLLIAHVVHKANLIKFRSRQKQETGGAAAAAAADDDSDGRPEHKSLWGPTRLL